jgi:hypothetical protein
VPKSLQHITDNYSFLGEEYYGKLPDDIFSLERTELPKLKKDDDTTAKKYETINVKPEDLIKNKWYYLLGGDGLVCTGTKETVDGIEHVVSLLKQQEAYEKALAEHKEVIENQEKEIKLAEKAY